MCCSLSAVWLGVRLRSVTVNSNDGPMAATWSAHQPLQLSPRYPRPGPAAPALHFHIPHTALHSVRDHTTHLLHDNSAGMCSVRAQQRFIRRLHGDTLAHKTNIGKAPHCHCRHSSCYDAHHR